MIKTIIATLILLAFPLLSHADGGVLEGISIGANATVDTEIGADMSTSSDSTKITPEDGQNASMSAEATSTTEVKSDGFFRRVVNWFKGLFD